MIKKNFLVFILLASNICLFAQTSTKAKSIASAAVKKDSVEETISFLSSSIKTVQTNSDKRSLYIFLAGLQEQMADYENAVKNYALAAGISAADAEGMPKKTNEQLVLDAVRCALCTGDCDTADSYLNTSVRNSKNSTIISYVKLYTQWSALCRAETDKDLQEPIEILKAYLAVSSMKEVQPVILLTLWYVTGDNIYSANLTKDFPKSTEAAIIKGDVQLLPVPFWFFVPKSGVAEIGTGSLSDSVIVKTEDKADTKADDKSSSEKFTKWQLGLFGKEDNAKALCEELKKKGFTAYITSEKRSSGTTYFLVFVNETPQGNVCDRLRSAGYDCYPVE